MIPFMQEVLVGVLLLAGAAALIFIPLWLSRTRGGAARAGLLGNASERRGFTLHPGTPRQRAREAPAASQRR